MHNTIRSFRAQLNACAELSGHEQGTLALLQSFLTENTSLSVIPMDGWLLATHWEGDACPTYALRADMDALPGANGPWHGCGHDGHCAILCRAATMLEGRELSKNIHFIFQPAEETGEGARHICDTWSGLGKVARIFGFHNLPGYPMGHLLTCPGCFACASEGLSISVTGSPAHAAYPERGENPADLVCAAVSCLPKMAEDILRVDDRLLMATVVGMKIGDENYGLSAADGKLWLTLRAHRDEDLRLLEAAIKDYIRVGCRKRNMTCHFEIRDAFPDTVNDPEITRECEDLWRESGRIVQRLREPMRWSEDFGWYLKRVPGMYFGIGMGRECADLHTSGYRFDDDVIEPAAEAILQLLENGR